MSRVCIVPFKKPSIAPVTDDEVDVFDTVEEMIEHNQLS